METTPTWLVYAAVGLIGALIGFGVGCFFAAMSRGEQSGLVGGALAVLVYFLIWDSWNLFHYTCSTTSWFCPSGGGRRRCRLGSRAEEGPPPSLHRRLPGGAAEGRAPRLIGRQELHAGARLKPGRQTIEETLEAAKVIVGGLRELMRRGRTSPALLRRPSTKDHAGCTPLHLAVDRNDAATVIALLNAGADPNAQDDSEETPLHWAVKTAKEGGSGRDGHWRTSHVPGELMSPWISADAPLSAITVQALADLGYEVDPDRAEPYEITRAAKVLAGGPRWHCGVGKYEGRAMIRPPRPGGSF